MVDLNPQQHGIWSVTQLDGMNFEMACEMLGRHGWVIETTSGDYRFFATHPTGARLTIKTDIGDTEYICSAWRRRDLDLIDRAVFFAEKSAGVKVATAKATDGPFKIPEKYAHLTKTSAAGWALDRDAHGVKYLEEIVGMNSANAGSMLVACGWKCSIMDEHGGIKMMHPDGKTFSIASRWYEDGEELIPGTGKWYVDAVDDLHIATDDEIIDFMLSQNDRTCDLDT